MRTVNKVILIGAVGSDPDVRVTPSGAKVARITLATENPGTMPSQRTDWHRVVVWEPLAQTAEDYVSKGDRLYVEGYLMYDAYERDGVTIPTAEIRGESMVLLSPEKAREKAREKEKEKEKEPDPAIVMAHERLRIALNAEARGSAKIVGFLARCDWGDEKWERLVEELEAEYGTSSLAELAQRVKDAS